jgi:hypothetical protein
MLSTVHDVRYVRGKEPVPESPALVRNDREKTMTVQVAEEIADLDINDIKVVSSEVIDRALSTIDAALAQMVRRELVSADEVSDLLLDVRNLLTSAVRG